MSNPKSKMPVAKSYFDESTILEDDQMEEYDHDRLWSSFSRKRVKQRDDTDNILKERTENKRVGPEIYGTDERNIAHVTRRKSLRITYDPEREPGAEYLVEKGVDDDDAGLQRAHSNGYIIDDSPEDLNDFPDGFETDGPIATFRSNTWFLNNTEIGNDSEKENVDLVHTRAESELDISDENKSVSLESFRDSEPSDTLIPSTPLIPLEEPTQFQESPTYREHLPVYIEPDPTSEVAPKPAPDIQQEPVEQIFEPEPVVNTLDSAKESTSSSLPPTNFKTSLFKLVRRVSTPRKSPRFTPRPDKTPNKTPVIDDLGEHDQDNDEQTSIYISPAHSSFDKDSLSRFQRQDSSESIRIHYDKHIRRETHEPDIKSFTRYEQVNVDINARTKFKRLGGLQDVKKVERAKETESSSKIPPVPKQSDAKTTFNTRVDLPVKENMRFDQKNYENHLSILAKKPVPHKVPVKTDSVPIKHEVKTKETISNPDVHDKLANAGLEDSDDIFSESEKRSKLKQAQYITDGLKLVKKKVKEAEMTIKQTAAKQEQDSSKKRSVLKSLNTQRKQNALQRNSLPSKLPRPSKNEILNLLNVKQHDSCSASESGFEAETQTEVTDNTSVGLWNTRTKLLNRNRNRLRSHRPSIDTKSSIPTQSQYSLETLQPPSSNTWNPQPRVHRPKPIRRPPRRLNKISKKSERTFFATPTATASTNSVERWVVQAIKENTMSRDTLALPMIKKNMGEFGLRNKIKKPKLKVILPKKKKPNPTNAINMGMYLPLPTRPKRRARHVYTQVGKVKGYESEIPILYSDDDDASQEQRPNTVNDRRRYHDYRGYDGDSDQYRMSFRDPAHRKVGRTTGALVRLFRNGDPDHKGIPLTINQKFKNFEALMMTLNDKIPTPTGVRHIFKWPECKEIKSVKEFQNRCVYIVSSTKRLNCCIKYGESREGFWSNRRPSAGKVRSNEINLFKKPPCPKGSPKASPYVLIIVNNLQRDKRGKIFLNPHVSQPFEEWLEDINNQDIPVRALYTDRPPYTQIRSFSHLFRELRFRSTFIACGDECLPVELAKKRQAPSSNSSSESVIETRGRKKPPRQRDMEFWPPSYLDGEDDGARPGQVLKCQWVYGFRGRDARHNLSVIPDTGELVYYVASIVVLYDKRRETQRHYSEHNEEISCLTLHPNGRLIATGQLHGKEPEHSSHIRIWDHETLNTYSVIGLGVFYGGIISIGFSHQCDGTLMCALDGSSKHVLSVWRVSADKKNRGEDSNYIIARTSTSTDPVHCACFYPYDENNSILITYGAKHIYFWKIFFDATKRREAKIFRDRSSGIFEEHRPKSVNCLSFLSNGDVVTGDSSGNLMVWDRDASDAFTCKYVLQAHQGPIMSVIALKDGTILSGGGNEIKGWDSTQNFMCASTRTIPAEVGGVRSIVTLKPGGSDGNMYIGTTRSCILEGSMKDMFSILVQGHSDGILGLVPHPEESTFITAGSDAVVYKWSVASHRIYWRAKIEAPCTSLAVDHNDELVAIGTSEGTFVILNAFNGMHIASVQVGTETISCIAFSPNGLYLAVGCNDGLITIFNVHNRGHTYVKASVSLRGHHSGVAHLDWSEDINSLRSVSHDNELKFWDLVNMQPCNVPMKTRDIEWFTNTCSVSYALVGPWTNLDRGERIKVVSRSKKRDLVLVGDSVGRLRLYKYPSSRERADFRNVRVYSSEVTAMAFTRDSRTVLTCGGNDAALIQWSVEEEFQ